MCMDIGIVASYLIVAGTTVAAVAYIASVLWRKGAKKFRLVCKVLDELEDVYSEFVDEDGSLKNLKKFKKEELIKLAEQVWEVVVAIRTLVKDP